MSYTKKTAKSKSKLQYDPATKRIIQPEPTPTSISSTNPKAIIYCRVSGDKQVKEGHGLEGQESKCKERCEKNNIPVVKVFMEGAVSGAKKDREVLNLACKYLEEENKKYTKITHFVCTEHSRISRPDDLLDALEIEERIKSYGIQEIITVFEPTNSKTDEGVLLKHIQYAIAGYERKKIAKRCKNGRRARLLNGYRPFPSPPVGYKRLKSGKEYIEEIDPEKGPIIKEGLELYANNVLLTPADLYQYRKNKKLTTSYDKKGYGKLWFSFIEKTFDPQKLHFYAGLIINPLWDVMEPIEGRREPLISLDVLHRILTKNGQKQKILGKKPNIAHITDNFPLRGVVTCPGCGRKLTSRFSKSHTGEKYPYYGCSLKECKERSNIPKEKMENEFKNLLEDIKIPEEIFLLFSKIFEQERTKRKERNSENKVIKQGKMRQIENRMKEIEGGLLRIKETELCQKLENDRSLLNEEKRELERQLQNEQYTQTEMLDLIEKTKGLFKNPLAFRELGSTEIKSLLITVRFGQNLYYKKDMGYRTSEKGVLYSLMSDLKQQFSVSWVSWGSNPGPPP